MDSNVESEKLIIKKESCKNEYNEVSSIDSSGFEQVDIKPPKLNYLNGELCSDVNHIETEERIEMKDEIEEPLSDDNYNGNWEDYGDEEEEDGFNSKNFEDNSDESLSYDIEENCDSVSDRPDQCDLSTSLRNMYGLSDVQLQNLSILFGDEIKQTGRNYTKKRNVSNDTLSNIVRKRQRYKILSDGTIQTFRCEICNKEFKNKSHLKSHLVIHSDVKNFSCEVCHREFNYKTNLEKHLLTHTGIKNHECHICSRKFTLNSHLKAHLVRHEKHKQLVCNTCGKQFYKKTFLLTHLKMHEGLQVYVCDICKNEFRRKYHLIQHLRQVHTDERDHVCNICNMSFNQKSNLNRHVKRHIGEKAYLCNICGLSFNEKVRLTDHYNDHK